MKKTVAIIMILAAAFAAFACVPNGADPASPSSKPESEALSFTGEDVNGNEVSMASFAGSKVIMLNLWETWCGPCMGELGDINRLYAAYRDRGLAVIGAYSSSGTNDVKAAIESLGLTYTIMPAVKEFMPYATRYVPTTVFFDGEGNLLSKEPYVGARSYEEWESVILSYLGA